MKTETVNNLSQIAECLEAFNVGLHDVAPVIAYKSRGKIFVAVEGGNAELRKHYQLARGAPVETVPLTPRDLKNVCVWIAEFCRARGIALELKTGAAS